MAVVAGVFTDWWLNSDIGDMFTDREKKEAAADGGRLVWVAMS